MMQIRLTPAVKALSIACLVVFLVQQSADRFLDTNLLGWFALVPASFVLDFRFWQIFTYPFLHADVMHLVLNLMMLVFIGSELEARWGAKRFLRYYFACSTGAGLFYLMLQILIWKENGLQMPMVGASGAIYGLLIAYGLAFSDRVLLFMMLFPMKAKHFVWVLAGVEFLTTVFSGRSGMSSAAHLAGMLVGFCYLWIGVAWKLRSRRMAVIDELRRKYGLTKKKPKSAKDSHLKLVVDNDDTENTGPHNKPSGDPKTWH